MQFQAGQGEAESVNSMQADLFSNIHQQSVSLKKELHYFLHSL